MSGPSTTIVWFRRDLRIDDNPALAAAAKEGSVLPVFVWCLEEEGQFYPGRASRWWLKQSLAHLDKSLQALGSPLLFLKAENTLLALLRCIGATGATKVVYNHLYDPVSLVRDHNIKRQLEDNGITVQTFNGDLLYEPWEVYDEKGYAFTNFNDFWEKCMRLPIEPSSCLPPWKLVPPAGIENVDGCSIEGLGLEYEMEKSSNALLSRAWSPGWSNAEKLLGEFVADHLLNYSKDRMKMETTSTSLLSPYLHYGEISVRKVYKNVRMKQLQWSREGLSDAEESVTLFLRSIGLREYSRYFCFNFPFTHERSLLGNLKHYPWRTDEQQFKIWRQGRTGYPLVDAGMRELWATGWMHNRTRVIAASFLVKYMLLPWRWGMKYFWDTLLDADLESDILGWQYVSGSLPDGHPLDRLDSPEVQGSRFDPKGEYVRHWLPELARMPTQWIHHPWNAPESVLRAAGVELGSNYPLPVVEIDEARERLSNAVTLMWELDIAEKMNGADEVVADNLISLKSFDIPSVVLKKEIACTSSYNDQRVPSFIPLKGCSHEPKKLQDAEGKRPVQENIQNCLPESKAVKMEEDLQSTAESSSGRKRSISESHYVVPMPSFSSSEHKPPNYYASPSSHFSIGSPSTGPWREAHNIYIQEEKEGDTDAQSTNECFRASKRPA